MYNERYIVVSLLTSLRRLTNRLANIWFLPCYIRLHVHLLSAIVKSAFVNVCINCIFRIEGYVYFIIIA